MNTGLVVVAAQRAGPVWERIRWGTADGWVSGGLTVIAVFLTYRLLRKQSEALTDDRAERRRDFFRSYAVTLRPILRDAREVFATITATHDIDLAWKDPLRNPLLRDLSDIRPPAALDVELSGHLDGVVDALRRIWPHSVAATGRDQYGDVIRDDANIMAAFEAAADGLIAAQAALQRLAGLEAP